MVFEGRNFVVHLHPDFDERAEFEMTPRGYLSHATVELADGRRYPIHVYDPVRLGQDLESGLKCGEPCIAEAGMIVVPEVTRAHVIRAVEYLVSIGYFQSLAPSEGSTVNGAAAGTSGAAAKR
jgi:hypothetical protein